MSPAITLSFSNLHNYCHTLPVLQYMEALLQFMPNICKTNNIAISYTLCANKQNDSANTQNFACEHGKK